LKTSVVRTSSAIRGGHSGRGASFQEAVVDVLVAKTMRAAEHVGRPGLPGRGVAANSCCGRGSARPRLAGIAAYLPSRAMCTDNAAMVAAAGWWRLAHDGPSPLSLGPTQPVLDLIA